MSDRAEQGLIELAETLREAVQQGDEAERVAAEAALVWCHVEQGALGAAFRSLWEHDRGANGVDGQQLVRAELQAFCGNEEGALSLLAGMVAGPAVSLVRARVAASRGDWESAVPWALEARGDEGLRSRATLLAVRAQIELGRSGEARTLLESLTGETGVVGLERALFRARLSDDPLAGASSVADQARAHGAVRLLADACADISMLHASRGDEEEARIAAVQAVELWDDMATSLAPPLRAGFWCDARRAWIRTASKRKKPEVATSSGSGLSPLLANLRRLASERDLAKLLALITDGAVALSGAERGFVLLTDEHGALETAAIRTAEDQLGPQTAAFSRSIAETVLIDGDPVVTVDASHDARVQDYLSVHQLMLKSVACLPIRSRGRIWGVLYLEHRSMSGRFSGTDLSLLRAYADQAAIAIETSRLFEQVERHKQDLERTNEALREANEHLEQRIQGQADALQQTRREVARLHASRSMGKRWGLVGASEGMRRVYDVLDRVAASDVPVVITGESGTGKELVARALHESSARANQPYVSINCGAIPDGLLESELFGHVAGAFTGASRTREGVFVQAHGGTLFMDEIADMPPRMQLDLLRVLQEQRVRPVGASEEKSIDVRLVTATKSPLSELVAEGKVREDLYYRLAVVELRLPPLRDRREDIPLLCEHFLGRIADERGEPKKILSRAALQRLCAHDFPGNVRELEHLLVNATVFAVGDTIEVEELAIQAKDGVIEKEPVLDNYRDFKDAERNRILTTLNAHGWNRAKAARALGMARRTFYRRLKEHNIELPTEGA
ncbi:MAG: sigma-54-dependent Fis family transcriptional regulator [Myxococcales bacterium]|nr:sigma-54-dependent Fis family transcriptional regulator [Myxococcales bacterium]MDH3483563.1 sigma-54-dependent Fis family transcriptional regulator [Myxococcales bacterium]